jgi:hypothetical protein
MLIVIIIIIIIIMLVMIMIIINVCMPVQQNSFTHVMALLVLHDCGILALAASVTGHYSSN